MAWREAGRIPLEDRQRIAATSARLVVANAS